MAGKHQLETRGRRLHVRLGPGSQKPLFNRGRFFVLTLGPETPHGGVDVGAEHKRLSPKKLLACGPQPGADPKSWKSAVIWASKLTPAHSKSQDVYIGVSGLRPSVDASRRTPALPAWCSGRGNSGQSLRRNWRGPKVQIIAPPVRRCEKIGVLVQIERRGFALIWWPERTRRGSAAASCPRVKAQASLRTPKTPRSIHILAGPGLRPVSVQG